MTLATAAESKLINAASVNPGRASVVAETSDSVQNIIDIIKANGESAAGNQTLSIPRYIGFIAPTAAAYPGAPIGSEYIEITVDSTKTPKAYTRKDWVLTVNGWEKRQVALLGSYEVVAMNVVTTAGGNTTEDGLLTGALTTDTIEVVAYGLGYAKSAACAVAGNFICTLSADPGSTGTLIVKALRVVA